MTWNPRSWRTHTAHQQPSWPDADHVDAVTAEIASLPALVFPGEIDRLRADLARVADGHAFLLQAGDCAETFTPNTEETVREKLQIILQMIIQSIQICISLELINYKYFCIVSLLYPFELY